MRLFGRDILSVGIGLGLFSEGYLTLGSNLQGAIFVSFLK